MGKRKKPETDEWNQIVLPKDPLHPEYLAVEVPKHRVSEYYEHEATLLEGFLHVKRAYAETIVNGKDPQAARYATDLIKTIDRLKKSLDADARMAVMAAMEVGCKIMVLRIYLEAPYVQQVKDNTRKLRAGAKSYDSETRQEAIERWKELQNDQPDRKLSLIDQQVAGEFGIGIRTLQRWRSR